MYRQNIPCKERKFVLVPCTKPKLREEWRTNFGGKTMAEKMVSRKQKEQKASCKLTVEEFRHPSDKQGYLFVNERERVGAKRITYLHNPNIAKPRIGKKVFQQMYQPELDSVTHGVPNCYENGVARCLGEWQEMEPSRDPQYHPRDHVKINHNAQRLQLVKEAEFDVYRRNVNIEYKKEIRTGRRDQTIFYPKDMTFGMRSEPRECLYDILGNKDHEAWIKERKELDTKICNVKLEKLRKEVRYPTTRSSDIRTQHNLTVANPPEESPRPLTRLRKRSKAKVSSTWDVDEVLGLLHCHPEADERIKLFSLPSKHNLYYNELHNPDKLDYALRMPDRPRGTSRLPLSATNRRSLSSPCKPSCPQCQSLICCCATERVRNNTPTLATTIGTDGKKHVSFNDSVDSF